jgi:hypothetical protein
MDRHRSSIQHMSHPETHGIRVRQIKDDTYVNVEREQEEVCLLC